MRGADEGFCGEGTPDDLLVLRAQVHALEVLVDRLTLIVEYAKIRDPEVTAYALRLEDESEVEV